MEEVGERGWSCVLPVLSTGASLLSPPSDVGTWDDAVDEMYRLEDVMDY